MALNIPAARRLRFALTADALERFANGGSLTVLDAGCGEGALAQLLAKRHPDWNIVAADSDEFQLERARGRLHESRTKNVQVRQLDLTGDLGQSVYDAVLAIECLVEISDDDAAIASMAAALRPGGLFIAHVPAWDWTPVLPRSETTWRHQVRHGYDAEILTSKLSGVGLTVSSIRPSTRVMVRVVQELRDRVKNRSNLRLAVYPMSLVAVELERHGFAWGHPRALFVEALRK